MWEGLEERERKFVTWIRKFPFPRKENTLGFAFCPTINLTHVQANQISDHLQSGLYWTRANQITGRFGPAYRLVVPKTDECLVTLAKQDRLSALTRL